MRLIALLAAALAIAGMPALAQPAAGPAAAQVKIAFAPPLDTPLRFRITNAKVRSDRPAAPKASWIEELRFARSGDGFILRWRMVAESLPPEMRDPAVAPMIAPFIGEPIAFDLDEDGSLLRVRDWEKVRPKLIQVVEGSLPIVAAQAESKAQSEQIIAQMRAMFESLDAEQATGVLLKNIAPLLQWGGVSMRVGERIETTDAEPVPMLGGSVVQNVRATLTAVDPGQTARIEVRTETDRDSLRQLVAALAQRFGPNDDPAKKEEMLREMAKMERMEVVDTSVVLVDLATGLPRTLDHDRQAKVEGVTQSETLRIEWLR